MAEGVYCEKMQKCAKISGISCIVYTHVAKAFKDNLILFFDVRMYVAFRSLEKKIIVLLKTIITILMIMMAMITIFKKRMYIKYSKIGFWTTASCKHQI